MKERKQRQKESDIKYKKERIDVILAKYWRKKEIKIKLIKEKERRTEDKKWSMNEKKWRKEEKRRKNEIKERSIKLK